MKLYINVFIVILLFVSFTACNNKKTNHEISTVEEVNSLSGVSFEVENNSYTKDVENITAKFVNSTDNEYMYGESYSLEYLDNDIWVVVPFKNACWEDIGYILDIQSTAEIIYNIKDNFGSLQSGKYRIITHITDMTNSNKEKYNLAAEFDIE